MAYIQKRTGKHGDTSYRVIVRVKGYPTQCATFSQKKMADEWATKTEIAIKEGSHLAVVAARRHTLGEAIDRYLTDVLPTKRKVRDEVFRHLAVWKESLGKYALIAVKPDVIKKAWADIAAKETPKGGQKSPATLNRYMASLSVVFTYAYKNLEWVDTNPIEKIKKYQEPRGRRRYLTDDERERLLAACKESLNPLLYPVVILALTTGARHNEILNLRWADIDLASRRATLQETKNGESRTLAIVEPALSLLCGLADKKGDSEFVFYSRRDTGEMHHANITNAWYAAMKKADIKDFRFHDLRHTAASYLAMHGASLAEIAEILGHKTLQTTKRYAHLSDAHKHRLVERVNQEIFGNAKPELFSLS